MKNRVRVALISTFVSQKYCRMRIRMHIFAQRGTNKNPAGSETASIVMNRRV